MNATDKKEHFIRKIKTEVNQPQRQALLAPGLSNEMRQILQRLWAKVGQLQCYCTDSIFGYRLPLNDDTENGLAAFRVTRLGQRSILAHIVKCIGETKHGAKSLDVWIRIERASNSAEKRHGEIGRAWQE